MTSITPDQVRNQFERILLSPEFNGSKRLRQFLGYVVEEKLNGRADNIKQYTVAIEALGFGPDFDPDANPTVRILAGRLRRAIDQYYFNSGSHDPVLITIPKGSYIPVFLQNNGEHQKPEYPQTSAAFSVQAQNDPNPTIAVVMFDFLNPGNTFDYIATGLTEEIIIALTRFPDFKIMGPLSRSIIQEHDLDTSKIGHQFGARFILDGTVRMNGENFRLTVRLTDASNGQQLWGDAFDCSQQNGSMMELQNNVVGKVAATVADFYGAIPRVIAKESFARQPQNPTAHEAVLYFYHYIKVLTPESYTNAMQALEKAVLNDPDDALCSAMLGDLLICTYLFGISDDESILLRSERLAEKAIALDPTCQAAHFVMAMIHFIQFQRSLFLDEMEHVLQLNPNNAVYTAALAMHLGMVGEWDRALKLMDKAIYLNPHHPGWYHIVSFMNYYCQGKYDLAFYEAQRFNTKGFFWDPLIRAAALGELGNKAEAEKALEELLALVPDFSTRGKNLTQRLAYLEDHVDMLWDGLQKAGLEF